jgi:serine/threonine-protein kinase
VINAATVAELAWRASQEGLDVGAEMVNRGLVVAADLESLMFAQVDVRTSSQTLAFDSMGHSETSLSVPGMDASGSTAAGQGGGARGSDSEAGTQRSLDEALHLGPSAESFERRYELGDELGRGGVGRVVVADDRLIGRRVAVKVLRADKATPGNLHRFLAEARTTAQLEHPNVVPVYDLGQRTGGDPWFSMKRVRGRSLNGLLFELERSEPDDELRQQFGRFQLLQIFNQVCNAVDYAHARGVIHRDLKPENIMVGDYGEVLVMDWGVARVRGRPDPQVEEISTDSIIATSGTPETLQGSIFGTPGYMAPEQARGDQANLDARADVWALGAILYEILTGQITYDRKTPLATLMATISEPVVPPRERAPDRAIPIDLEEICLRALAMDPNHRYPNVRALHAEIERFLTGARERERLEREASRAMGEGEEALWYFKTLDGELRDLTRTLESLPRLTGHEPPAEKRSRWQQEDRLRQLREERERALGWAEGKFTRAIELLPEHEAGRRALADLHRLRYRDARLENDRRGAARHLAAVGRFDASRYAGLLADDVQIHLESDPPGAQIYISRYEEVDRVLVPSGRKLLGLTPFDGRVPTGRHLLEVVAPGRRPVLLPIAPWNGDELVFRVRVPTNEAVGRDFVFVPGGEFLRGNDPEAVMPRSTARVHVDDFAIGRFPVTCAEYAAFLNTLDPEEAARRVPRMDRGGGPLWPLDARPWSPPVLDVDGSKWLGAWPALHVSAEDADAYCAWLTRETGVGHRLPTDDEWEKAARGTDGRLFPWGDHFDPTFCHMRDSLKDTVTPLPVDHFETDTSPYGVRTMAGACREWTATEVGGDRVVCGGAWTLYEFFCRPAGRWHLYPSTTQNGLGFRVVKALHPIGAG